ncbi:MAG: hypothetical protein NTU49_01810 [Gammaproteobacteria bacterium]|nr:hypothetical protein [Gammaproteobacteria bacterium]
MFSFDSVAGTFSPFPVPTPLKNVAYDYINSLRLHAIIDSNTVKPQTLTKIFDINRNVISIQEGLLRNTVMQYNARGWLTTLSDINFLLDCSYDPVGNRRNMNAIFGTLRKNAWNLFNLANRVLVNNGVMINGVIQSVYGEGFGYFAPSQGNTFSYANGLRNGQSLLVPKTMGDYADNCHLSAVISYDENEMPVGVSVTDETPTSLLSKPIVTVNKGYYTYISWPELFYNGTKIFNQAVTYSLTTVPAGAAISNLEFKAGAWSCEVAKPDPLLTPYILTLEASLRNGATSQSDPVAVHGELFYYPQAIQYTPDGLFSTTTMCSRNGGSPDTLVTQQGYNTNGIVNSYSDQVYGVKTQVSYPAFNADGIPITSIASWTALGSVPITDNLTNCFGAFDSTYILFTSATRTDQYGTNYITSNRFYDANYALNGVSNIANPYGTPQDTDLYYAFFDTSLDGHILRESVIKFSNPETIASNIPANYYHDHKGDVVVVAKTVVSSSGATEMVLELPANPVESFNASNLLSSISTIIQRGDTWESISSRLLGGPQYAAFLQAHSHVPLTPGQMINGSQILASYNKTHDCTPYEKLLNAICGALNPALKTPQPPAPPPPKPHHESWLDEFIEGIVAIVVLAFVPEAITVAFPTMFGSAVLSSTVAFTIGGAIASVADQGIAIAFGDQSSFSLPEMLEYAATSGITGGIGKAFDEADILGKEQYFRTFACTAAIATAVELFKVSVGLENKINIQFILEQAIAATIGAKLNSGLANVNSSVVNGADELEKTAVGAAFGYQQSAAILAQNYLEDEANTGADILASKAIQPQPSASTMVLAPSSSSSRNSGSGSSMGDVSVPSNFNSPALQTESRFISSSLSGDDVVMSDPIQSFYTASQDILRDDLDSMSAASVFALNSRVESNVTEVHAKQLQRSAGRVVNSPGWLSQEIYDHQHSWWAKGILGFTGAINSDAGQWLSRSLNTDGASAEKMDPFSAMGNTAAGYDPITGQAINIEQGYKNFGESMAGMFGGEVAGVGVGIGLGFAADALPSVGRNSASMFGRSEANALSPMRLRVMANIADARAGIKASFFDIHAVVEKILGFDVSTESNEAVFWSGPGNRQLQPISLLWE